jgi:hypothetical protein
MPHVLIFRRARLEGLEVASVKFAIGGFAIHPSNAVFTLPDAIGK